MEKIWLKSYPAGVPAEINVDQYASLRELLEDSCARFASRPAYSCMGRAITFTELDRLRRRFGAFLQGRGLVKGARVALMMPNILQYPVCLFGVLRAGLVVVNVNPLYTPRELEHQLNDSGAELIVVVENFAHTVAEVICRTDGQARRRDLDWATCWGSQGHARRLRAAACEEDGPRVAISRADRLSTTRLARAASAS